jgi:hypothetical protein
MTVGVNPLLEVDGTESLHVDDFRHYPKDG